MNPPRTLPIRTPFGFMFMNKSGVLRRSVYLSDWNEFIENVLYSSSYDLHYEDLSIQEDTNN